MSTLAEWYSSLVLKTGLKLIITALILTRYGTGAQDLMIITNPENQLNVILGTDVMFSVVPNQPPDNLTFSWFKDGQQLSNEPGVYSGANISVLTVHSIDASDEGNYTVRVRTSNVTVLSSPALLTLLDLPIIVVQPRDQLDIVEGANVTFTVNVSGLMISYQWQKDGVTISDSPGSYSGTMTNELTVFNVTDSEDEGFYSVIVSNSAGSVTSNQANLTLLEISCPPLEVPVNGLILYSSEPENNVYEINTQATYFCEKGYALIGGGNRTCEANDYSVGNWTLTPASCQRILCPPLVFENGEVTYTGDQVANFSVSTVAMLTCNEGFVLEGQSSRTCNEYLPSDPVGRWNGSASCEPIMCEGIAAPRNGQILYSAEGEDGFPVGTVANISCDPSYLLIGNDTRVCMANESMNGEWSGTTPTCAVITCPELEPIDNGYFQYQTETGVYIIGTTVQYTCNSSYILMGQSQRTCELNEQDGSSGTWSGEAPLCLEITCPPLEPPMNGQIRYSSPSVNGTYEVGTQASFSCDPGFALIGKNESVCDASDEMDTMGNWTSSAPSCLPIKCPPLSLENGQVDYTNGNMSEYDLGTLALLMCDLGFLLVGQPRRTCVDDDQADTIGVWSGTTTCQPITCPPLDLLDGQVTYSQAQEEGLAVGTEATYTCNEGYQLEGNTTTTCMANGEWSGLAPTCLEITCLALLPPLNGEVSPSEGTNFDVGTTVIYDCMDGYALIGDDTRNCMGDGQWNGTAPTCELILCPLISPIDNGEILYSSAPPNFVVGTIATFSCSSGYVLSGASSSTCMEDEDQANATGVWSGDIPSCEPILCPALEPPMNGRISYSSENLTLDTIATYTCDSGYILIGERTRICLAISIFEKRDTTGSWSGEGPYYCARVDGQCVYDSVFPFVPVNGFRNYQQLSRNVEDGSSPPINIPDGVVFGDKVVNTAYVNENGAISFEQEWKFAYPERFPTNSEQTMQGLVVAPFWSDNDIRREGSVRYATYSVEDGTRNPAGADLMERVNDYIQYLEAEDFNGRWLLVAHWNQVHPSPHGDENTTNIPQEELNKVNDYQAIIVSSEIRAYAIFIYNCGDIQWSTVGQNNLAVVGFNAGTSSDNTEQFFKNYRLSGLEGVGGNVSCEVKTSNLTNLIIRLPASESVIQNNKLNCILALENDTAILSGETTHAELAEMLDPCPCTRRQALEDDARFIPQTVSNENLDCFVSATPKMVEISSTGATFTLTQQCCYQPVGFGALITSTSDLFSGTLLLHHPICDQANYIARDKTLRDTCCNRGFCGRFYQQRPINKCSGYVGPKTSSGTGDPHYWTFDGRYHTFNGQGDFTILEIMSEGGVEPEFSIQGRLARVQRWQVTTHQGLVFGNENLAFHVATSASGPNGYRVYQTRPTPMRELTNTLQDGQEWIDDSCSAKLKRLGREIYLSFFQSRVSARIRANSAGNNEYYFDLFVKVPRALGLRVSGFLGSPDSDSTNDLFARDGNTSLPLSYGDRLLYPHLVTWMVDDGKGLFFDGATSRRKRETGSTQNGTNITDTTQPPTDAPTTVEPTTQPQEFVPIFLDELNFTDAQLMLCGNDQQCLFDFAVTGEENFAMETLTSNIQTQETRDTINNLPPNITANAIFRVNLGEESVFSINVADPGDNFTLELQGGLPSDSILEKISDGEYLFSWNLTETTNRTLEFVANDTRGAATVFIPRVEVCPCQNGGICTLNGIVTDDATVVMNCQCNNSYAGRFCAEDRDGCTAIQCFEGVECTDVPAPGVGAECGPCPLGFTGDSQKCYDIDECSENGTCSQICVNARGSFFCACFDGYQLVNGSSQCEDIDECEGVNDCQQLCQNTEGSYTCSCSEGFTLNSDNRTCNATEPCEGGCSFGCAVVNGTEQCYCPVGYELSSPNGTMCFDIDECLSTTPPCEQLCNNTEGSFLCACRDGYQLQSNNRKCEDINECFEAALRGEEICGRNSQCMNNEGSFDCVCVSGFAFVNDTCRPVTCLEVADIVYGSVIYAADTTAPFELGTRATYSCDSGFTLVGITTRICRTNSMNSTGLWTESPPVCEDIDECSQATDEELCGVNRQCVNTVGSYECVCATGYVLVNGTCEAITTSPPPPTTISPETKAIGALEVTLPELTTAEFNEEAQERFKQTTALVINDYCSQDTCRLADIVERARRQDDSPVTVTADDIILTEIRDNAEGELTFLMLIQVDGKVLTASDLQQAVQSGSEAYADANFPNLSSQPFMATTTSSPLPVTPNVGLAVGLSIGAFVALILVILMFVPLMYYCYVARFKDTYTVNKKRRKIEPPSTALEYQNPAATLTDDEADKKPTAVVSILVMS